MPALLFNRAIPMHAKSPTAPLDASTTMTSTTFERHPSSPIHTSDHTRKVATAVLASTLLVILLGVVGTVIYRQFWTKRSKRADPAQQTTPTSQVVLPCNASAQSSQETLAVPPSLKDGLEGKRWESEMAENRV